MERRMGPRRWNQRGRGRGFCRERGAVVYSRLHSPLSSELKFAFSGTPDGKSALVEQPVMFGTEQHGVFQVGFSTVCPVHHMIPKKIIWQRPLFFECARRVLQSSVALAQCTVRTLNTVYSILYITSHPQAVFKQVLYNGIKGEFLAALFLISMYDPVSDGRWRYRLSENYFRTLK